MNCPSCGAPMRAENDTLKCDYCHNIVVPEKNDDGVSVMNESDDECCPVCNLALMKATMGRLPLLYCTKCDGMLIAMDEFQDLIAASSVQQHGAPRVSPANSEDLRRHIGCPHCHQPMDAHFYGGPGNVVIDTCEACSLNWLDHGELARIAQAPASDFDSDSTAGDASYFDAPLSARPERMDANA